MLLDFLYNKIINNDYSYKARVFTYLKTNQIKNEIKKLFDLMIEDSSNDDFGYISTNELNKENEIIKEEINNEKMEWAEKIHKVFETICDEKGKLIFTKRVYEGKSYAEIANETGIKVNTLRSIFKRIKDKIKETILYNG